MKPDLHYKQISQVRKIEQLDHPARRQQSPLPGVYNYKPRSLRFRALLPVVLLLLALTGLLEYAVVRLPVSQSRGVNVPAEAASQKRDIRSDVVPAVRGIQMANEAYDLAAIVGSYVSSGMAVDDAASNPEPHQRPYTASSLPAVLSVSRTKILVHVANESLTAIRLEQPSSDTGRAIHVASVLYGQVSSSTLHIKDANCSTYECNAIYAHPCCHASMEGTTSTLDHDRVHVTQSVQSPSNVFPTSPTLTRLQERQVESEPRRDQFARTRWWKRLATVGASTLTTPEGAASTLPWSTTRAPSPATLTETARAGLYARATSPTEEVASPSSEPEPDSLDMEQDQPPDVRYDWTPGEIFVGSYLAVLIAVICRVVISTIANSLRLIDPFLQLSERCGAPADKALFSSYHEQSSILGTIRAISNRRWALASIWIASLAAALLPALASEAVVADTNWDCPYPHQVDHPNPCPLRLAVAPVVIRIAQAVLVLITALLLYLMGKLSTTTSALPHYPSSIAAIARWMAPVASDFILDSAVNHKSELRSTFHDKTYSFGVDASSSRYGIHAQPPTVGDQVVESPTPAADQLKGDMAPARKIQNFRNRLTRMQTVISDILLLTLVLAAFAVVLAYRLDQSYSGFNNYLNSNTFGPRFIFTGSGTVIATLWKNAEQRAMIMAPFRRMAKSAGASRGTLYFEPTTTPMLSTYLACRSRYWTVAIITIMTLLAELLSILIGSVPFAPGQTFYQYRLASYLCMSVLGAMILGVIVLVLG